MAAVADGFRVGRVLLLGGAAHVTNPSGGYDFAGGFFDSVALADALCAVIHRGESDWVLDRYAVLRRRNFTELVSPLTAESKQLLWPSDGQSWLADEIDRYREITSTRDRQRRYLLRDAGLKSAALRSERLGPAGGERTT